MNNYEWLTSRTRKEYAAWGDKNGCPPGESFDSDRGCGSDRACRRCWETWLSMEHKVTPDENGWIRVEDGLPEAGQETWVYALPPDGWKSEPVVEKDLYVGTRGWDANRLFYTITHWMPYTKPEPPVGGAKNG